MAYGIAMSRRGHVRPHNEDACCFLEATSPVGKLAMAIVCDGVGGLARGELASSTVVRRFVRWFEGDLDRLQRTCDKNSLLKAVQAEWLDMLRRVNADLLEYGRAIGAPLATTFTGLMLHEGAYCALHVGDCRLYLLSGDVACALTHDQTLVARGLELGYLTAEEAREHPQANIIYQAVGASERICPEVLCGRCEPDDLLLLLSDGAYRRASETLLSELFCKGVRRADERLFQACTRLLDQGLERGETDNLSLVAVRPQEQQGLGTITYGWRRSA